MRRLLRRVVAATLGAGLTAAGAIMLVAPPLFYRGVPGVSATGPLNFHFVRDIGGASLVTGAVFLVCAARRHAPTSALLTASGLLCVHAGLHVWELFGAGRDTAAHALRDLPAVYLPAVLAAWLAVDAHLAARVVRGG